ncbi:MAG: hypothetical protein JXR63_10550 [Spirochaetales bacterium]|nr:hypothetical protein [Spirochaetales bacterium]
MKKNRILLFFIIIISFLFLIVGGGMLFLNHKPYWKTVEIDDNVAIRVNRGSSGLFYSEVRFYLKRRGFDKYLGEFSYPSDYSFNFNIEDINVTDDIYVINVENQILILLDYKNRVFNGIEFSSGSFRYEFFQEYSSNLIPILERLINRDVLRSNKILMSKYIEKQAVEFLEKSNQNNNRTIPKSSETDLEGKE